VDVIPIFKQTEIGTIPDDWVVAPLEEFTSFISYGFTNPMPTSRSGVYMITARDINRGRIQFDTARCTTEDAYRSLLTAKSRPKSADLLLTKDGTLGRLALVDDRVVCINQSVAILRPNSKAVPTFLKILLEAPAYQARMLEDAGGSTSNTFI
jgi:type I restriction enzyme S subunit